jgi:hypothetical protein
MTHTLCLDTYVSDPMAVTTYDSDTMPGHLCLRPYAWTPMSQTLYLDTYVSDPMAVTTYDSDTMPGHL